MTKKKRSAGRPKTGEGVLVGVRCRPAFLKLVDKWRIRQPDQPSRPQAIIRLAVRGLKQP